MEKNRKLNVMFIHCHLLCIRTDCSAIILAFRYDGIFSLDILNSIKSKLHNETKSYFENPWLFAIDAAAVMFTNTLNNWNIKLLKPKKLPATEPGIVFLTSEFIKFNLNDLKNYR